MTLQLDGFDGFKKGIIAVRVGQKHLRQFLKMCEKEGLLWLGGMKPLDFIPDNRYGDDLTVGITNVIDVARIKYGSSKYFAIEGMEIIDFENTQVNVMPRYKIVIESDGTTTTARMEIDGRETKTAQAKRNPSDKPNWRVGAETAFERLWETERERRVDEPTTFMDYLVDAFWEHRWLDPK